MIPESILRAIGEAVEKAGGDLDDALDLLAVWERLAADKRGRADRLRYEAANPTCRCADGGIPGSTDRCERCQRILIADQQGTRK